MLCMCVDVDQCNEALCQVLKDHLYGKSTCTKSSCVKRNTCTKDTCNNTQSMQVLCSRMELVRLHNVYWYTCIRVCEPNIMAYSLCVWAKRN